MNPIAHLRRNVVAYLALFVALGTGSAYAAGQIKSKDVAKDAIRAKHIKDGHVRAGELATNAVSGQKIADDSITGADIDESTLRLPPPAAAPSAPNPPSPNTPNPPAQPSEPNAPVEPDLSGLARVVATGHLTGPGPLSPGDRCNSVGTTIEGAKFGDHVVLTPASLYEDVVFTGTVSADNVSYMACYTGAGSINIGGDVRFMLLRRN